MDTTAQIISAVIGVGIVLMIGPRVFALNQGKVLKNAAIWVGIFLLLAVAYKTVGPGASGQLVVGDMRELGSLYESEKPTDLPQPPAPQEENQRPPDVMETK